MRRRTTGQAMVEFMLALPLFLFILLGAIDFGRVVYAHTAISMNAEAAARLASVSAPRSDTDIVDRAMRISPAVPYSAANVAGQGGSFYPWGTDANGRVVVIIVVDVPIITPVVAQIVGGSVTVTARAEERVH